MVFDEKEMLSIDSKSVEFQLVEQIYVVKEQNRVMVLIRLYYFQLLMWDPYLMQK